MREATFEITGNEVKITFCDEEAIHTFVLTLALLPQGPMEISLLPFRKKIE